MFDEGKWVATAKSDIPGFTISQLYSEIRPWRDLVREFLEVKSDPSRLKAFVNTVLSEFWVERGEAPDWQILKGKAEDYRLLDVPGRALFITAGVDVQDDRLEVAVRGWARQRESWLIDYRVLLGKTDNHAVWDNLTDLLHLSLIHI